MSVILNECKEELLQGRVEGERMLQEYRDDIKGYSFVLRKLRILDALLVLCENELKRESGWVQD